MALNLQGMDWYCGNLNCQKEVGPL
jgi:hypothetical protein